jgi:hypothetical protein
MRIASLDTAITLFYTLSYVRGLEGLVPKSPHCFADALVQLSIKTRDQGMPSKFPLFPTTCHGHQPSKASLLEAKKARIESLKRKTRKVRSGKSSQKGGTRKGKSDVKLALDKLKADSRNRIHTIHTGKAALKAALDALFSKDSSAGTKFASKWSPTEIKDAIAVVYERGSRKVFQIFIGAGRKFTVLGERLSM